MSYILEEKPDLEYLAHFGVKGMKWGVRKARDKVGRDVRRARSSVRNRIDAHKKKVASRTPEQKEPERERARKRKRNIAIAGGALVAVGLVAGKSIASKKFADFVLENGRKTASAASTASRGWSTFKPYPDLQIPDWVLSNPPTSNYGVLKDLPNIRIPNEILDPWLKKHYG